MKNKRLGRGLEALIPQISPEDEQTRGDSLFEVDVSKVGRNPKQPRTDIDRKGLDELKQSILENGIIQPITVRRTADGFELISGERRLRAVQELGMAMIPAFLLNVESEDQMLELALVENIQREDLNPIELARAYNQLMKEYGLSQETVAQKVGKDRATVANFIRLLKLPAVIQESLGRGELSMGHAKALLTLASAEEQKKLWIKTVKQAWSVRKLEEVVQDKESGGEKTAKPVSPKLSPLLREVEDKLRTLLGTKVSLRPTGQQGRIEIHYYSNDDLERIIEVIRRAAE